MRVWVFALVLCAEVLIPSLLVDAWTFSGVESPWLHFLLRRSGLAARWAVCAGVCLFLVSLLGRHSRRQVEFADNRPIAVRASWLFVHILAYLSLLAGTLSVFGEHAGSDGNLPVLGWLLSAFISFVSLGLLARPWSWWTSLLRRDWSRLALTGLLSLVVLQVGWAAQSLWPSLHAGTFRAAGMLLERMHHQVVCDTDGYRISVGDFAVNVGVPCSGLEGMGLVAIFMGIYLFAFRKDLRFPAAFALFPLAIVLMWLCNVVRIATLVSIGAWGWPEIAVGGFHSQAGWLAFNAVALGLVVASRKFQVFQKADARRDEESDADSISENPTAPYLMPLLSILAATMITGAFTGGSPIDRLYPIRVLAAFVALYFSRSALSGLLQRGWSLKPVLYGVAVFAIWTALEGAGQPAVDARIGESIRGMPLASAFLWLLFRTVGAVITVPIAEELAFRGFLARRLVSSDFTSVSPRDLTWLAIVGSSLVFGLLHQRMLAGTIAGVLLAFSYTSQGRLRDAILAHATANGLITVLVLATGRWSSWS